MILRMGEGGGTRTKSIPAALPLTFMGHGRLYFILDSYSMPGIDFSPTARPKIPAQDYIPSQPGLGMGTM